MSAPPAARRRIAVAAIAAALPALAAGICGVAWGLPSVERLERLLPDAAQRAAVLRLVSASAPPEDDQDGDPTAACAGPIDPGSGTSEALWLRNEIVPYLLGSDDPDEMETFASIAKVFGRAPLDARAFLYGHVYLAAVAGAQGAALLTGFLPRLPSRADLLRDPDLLRRLYVAGRSVSILAVALLAAGIAAVLARVGLGPAAIAAAVLAGLAPMTVAAAHVAKPHAMAALFGFAAVAACWRAAGRMRPLPWALAAACLALAASASPPSALLGVAAPAAILARRPRADSAAWRSSALAFFATGLGAALLLNPLALAHPDLFGAHARHHLAGSGWGYGQFHLAKLLHFLARFATEELALAALPLVLLGLCACCVAPDRFRVYIAVVAGVALFGFGGFLGVPRIALVLAPLLALVAGFGADLLVRRLPPAAGRAALAILFAGLAVDVAASAESFRRPDPGEGAAAWIRDHLAAGSCLTLRADRPLATFLPRFDLLRYRLRRVPMDAALPAPGADGDAVLLAAAAPETGALSGWLAPTGRYRLLARFPERPFTDGILLRGPRRPRTVLILAAAPALAVSGAADR